MSFLSPLFLFGALAAAIPVVLHFLRRRPEARVTFPAVRLLRDAPVERADRRRLNDLLLLALRVAALLLLAGTFARPFFSSASGLLASRVTVIALDTSLSMSGPDRFERARMLARQAIDKVEPGGLVAVLTFADAPRVLVDATSDRTLARATIDTVTPGFGATSYRAALNAAGQVIAGRPGTIVVVTDLQEGGWDDARGAMVAGSTEIRVADVGELPANLALAAVKMSRDRIVATVRNTGSVLREARVRLTVDGAPPSVERDGAPAEVIASVPANQSIEVPFPLVPGRSARVAVDDPGGLEGDNARFLVLDDAAQPAVLVVTATGVLSEDAFYLQQALTAPRSDGGAYMVEAIDGAHLSDWNQSRLSARRALVLTSTRGLERRGRELVATYVTAGGGVLVGVGPGVDGDVLAEALGLSQLGLEHTSEGRRDGDEKGRRLAGVDLRHPVFASFGDGSSLSLVRFAKVAAVRSPNCQTLARFTTGEAAVVDCSPGRGRALLLASDLNNRWNDFPLHATFVPFLHETIRYVGERGSRAEYLVGDVPQGVAPRPGVVPAPGGEGGAGRLVAVNVDPRESDPRRLTEDEYRATVGRMRESARASGPDSGRLLEGRQQIWRYLLALMVVVLVSESFIAKRAA